MQSTFYLQANESLRIGSKYSSSPNRLFLRSSKVLDLLMENVGTLLIIVSILGNPEMHNGLICAYRSFNLLNFTSSKVVMNSLN